MSDTTDGTTEGITVDQAAENLLNLATAQRDKAETSEPQKAEAEPPEPKMEEAPESDTDSDEESESGEDAEEATATAPEPRKIKVKTEDFDGELPEDEVAKGYMRTADYTRKTQAAAELRKSLEAEAAAVKAERSQYAAHLNDLRSALESMQGKEPDWETLKQGDPATFAATYTSWKIGQDNIAKVAAEQANVAARANADAMKERAALLERESEKLKDVIPSWKDDAVAKAEKVEIVNYARSQGFTDEELSQVTDHRTLKLLHNAWLGSKVTAAKPAIQAKIEAVKVAAPGAVASAPKSREQAVKEAAKRVAKSGSTDDFQDWLVKRAALEK